MEAQSCTKQRLINTLTQTWQLNISNIGPLLDRISWFLLIIIFHFMNFQLSNSFTAKNQRLLYQRILNDFSTLIPNFHSIFEILLYT